MVTREVTVTLKSGLQARPAALFVQEANRFGSHVTIQKNHQEVNAKSIMGVMSLAIRKDTAIVIKAEGNDAEDAVNALEAFVTEH
ncbi:catabolite repression HPr-like protein Crh [Geomicrobium sp. JCM 19037]|uniref:HPr family phosphocarrier protein n=1 Tax=unclassified Geomicrobium TaxID=2628951 RepID=UPI00045F37B8|nr:MULTISPECIES: HPr family phosphocarrier protein [unclassified Geomicrobium]GAK02668.1 catabolite repression HPr-like protein Crh [Geomicrobium sp. JCM 19037]GAK11717.1 catabolite repression HPr-like protein Crh [Geomicrobium sp. JCM 19039]